MRSLRFNCHGKTGCYSQCRSQRGLLGRGGDIVRIRLIQLGTLAHTGWQTWRGTRPAAPSQPLTAPTQQPLAIAPTAKAPDRLDVGSLPPLPVVPGTTALAAPSPADSLRRSQLCQEPPASAIRLRSNQPRSPRCHLPALRPPSLPFPSPSSNPPRRQHLLLPLGPPRRSAGR